MKYLVKLCDRFGLLRNDLDHHVVRASMVLVFLFFGYQKWWNYEAQALIPYISNGPLIFWMYPVFGVRGACWFRGVSEWTFGALLFMDSGTRRPGFLARSAEWLRSSLRQRSFHSYRTDGPPRPAAFPQ